MLIVDVIAVVVSFAPSATASALARRAFRMRSKALQSALNTTSNPRLTRCSLKLLASAAALSPSLAREVLRRIPLGGKTAERLGSTRAADAMDAAGVAPAGGAESGAAGGYKFNAKGGRAHPSAHAARDRKAAKNASAGAPGSMAKFIYAHGHADDDVRANFVRLVCALLSCPASDVVKDAVRTRGLLPALLRGVGSDPAPVALNALGALGGAIFISGGAVPQRALLEMFPPSLLGSLATKLYGRVDEPHLRRAAHAFLVPLITGRLLLPPAPKPAAAGAAGEGAGSSGGTGSAKRRRVADEGDSDAALLGASVGASAIDSELEDSFPGVSGSGADGSSDSGVDDSEAARYIAMGLPL